MEFAPNLVPVVMDEATGLDARIANMRNHIASEFGLILPEIRLTDNPGLPPGTYAIRIQGVEAARSAIETDRVLVLLPDEAADAPEGRTVAEPVYGAPARWIAPSGQEQAVLMGLSVVTPTEVVATHLLEVVKANFGRLFNRRALRKLLDEFAARLRSEARRDEPADARGVHPRQGPGRHAPGRAPPPPRGAGVDPQPAADPRGDRRGRRPRGRRRGALRARPPPPRLPARRRHPGAGRDAAADPARSGLGGAVPERTRCPTAPGIVDVALPPAEFNRLAAAVAERDRPGRRAGPLPGGRHLDHAAGASCTRC